MKHSSIMVAYTELLLTKNATDMFRASVPFASVLHYKIHSEEQKSDPGVLS